MLEITVQNLLEITNLPLDVRVKLTSPEGIPQSDFLYTVISEWEGSQKFKDMTIGTNYYRNVNDINDRTKYRLDKDGNKIELSNMTNSKLSHPFMRKLTNQKIGYFLNKPFTIRTENSEFNQALKKYFTKEFFRKLENVGIDAICCGIAWLQVYYDENSKLQFKRIPPQEIIPFWKDADHTILDAVVRSYKIEEYDGRVKTEVKRVEYYNKDGVYKYKITKNGLVPESIGPEGYFEVVQVKDGQEVRSQAVWDNLPFIAFKYNKDELGLINLIKSLIDDYDINTSETSNIIQDTPNCIKLVKDYDGSDKEEFIHNLSTYRVAFTGSDGGIDKLETPVQTDAVDSHLNRLRKDIFEFGGGVDIQNKELRDTSGVALKFLYADLDMDCSSIINQFNAALDKLIWFIVTDLRNKSFFNVEYDIIFNTDIIVNENETINNLVLSQPFLSLDTVLANHPYVVDPKLEKSKIEQDKQKEAKEEERMLRLQSSLNKQNVSQNVKK